MSYGIFILSNEIENLNKHLQKNYKGVLLGTLEFSDYVIEKKQILSQIEQLKQDIYNLREHPSR